jgi:hypothetical protein
MVEINATGGNITPNIARFTMGELFSQRLSVDEIAMHPAQVTMVLESAIDVETIISREAAADESPYNPMTFCGRPIIQDPSMPKDEIHFRYGGETIAKIIALAIPNRF